MGLIWGDETLFSGVVSTQRIYDTDNYIPSAKKALVTALTTNKDVVNEIIKASLKSPAISLGKFYDNHQKFESRYENVYPTQLYIADAAVAEDRSGQTITYQRMQELLEEAYPTAGEIPIYAKTYDPLAVNINADTGRYRQLTPREWGIFVLGKTYFKDCQYVPIVGQEPTFTYVENGITKTLSNAVANGQKVTLTITYGNKTETKLITGYSSTHWFDTYVVSIGYFGDPNPSKVLFVYDLTANNGVEFELDINSQVLEYSTLYPVIPIKRYLEYMDSPTVREFPINAIGLDLVRLFNSKAANNVYLDYVKDALQTVGFNFYDLKAQLQKAEVLNEGDDNTEVGFASFSFTANVNHTAPAVVKYLFHFFDYLRDKRIEQLELEASTRNNPATYDDSNSWNEPLIVSFRLQDTGTRSIACRRITKTVVNSVLSTEYSVSHIPTWQDPSGSSARGKIEYKKRIDANSYYLLSVEGIEFRASYPLYTSEGYRSNQQGNTYLLSGDPESLDYSNNIVPFHKPTVDLLTPIEQEILAVHGASLTTFSITITRLSWYETSLFADTLQFITIVLLIIGGLGAESLGDFIIETFLNVLVSAGVIEALKFIATEIDNEFLQVLLTAATVYVYVTFGFGDKVSDAIKAINAVNVVSESYFYAEFEELTKDWEEFSEERDQLLTLMDERTFDNIETTGLTYEFLMTLQRYKIAYEEPDSFFRSKLNTNPGVATLDFAKYYTARALNLANVTDFDEDQIPMPT